MSKHWEMCENASNCFHFLLFPLLLSQPPAIGGEEKVKVKGGSNKKMTDKRRTFSGLKVDGVGDNVLQFHQFQFERRWGFVCVSPPL
jgi:hypothetical protein